MCASTAVRDSHSMSIRCDFWLLFVRGSSTTGVVATGDEGATHSMSAQFGQTPSVSRAAWSSRSAFQQMTSTSEPRCGSVLPCTSASTAARG